MMATSSSLKTARRICSFSNSTFDVDEILLKEEEDKLYEELQNYTGNEEEGDLSYGQEQLKSTPDGIYKI